MLLQDNPLFGSHIDKQNDIKDENDINEILNAVKRMDVVKCK